MFVVFHRGFARRERDVHVAHTGNCLQRTRYFCSTAATGHAGYLNLFGLHCDALLQCDDKFGIYYLAMKPSCTVHCIALGQPNRSFSCRPDGLGLLIRIERARLNCNLVGSEIIQSDPPSSKKSACAVFRRIQYPYYLLHHAHGFVHLHHAALFILLGHHVLGHIHSLHGRGFLRCICHLHH